MRGLPAIASVGSHAPCDLAEGPVLLVEARRGAWRLSDFWMDARPSPRSRAPWHRDLDVLAVHVLRRENPHRPQEPTLTETVRKLGVHAVPCIGQCASEANSGGPNHFVQRNAPLGTVVDVRRAPFARSRRATSSVHDWGRYRRSPIGAGTSSRASVCETRLWQWPVCRVHRSTDGQPPPTQCLFWARPCHR
jgi:hypothetical protein